MTKLDEIFGVKRRRVAEAMRSADLSRVAESARKTRSKFPPHPFRFAVENRTRLNIIAEFKRASPSKGVIGEGRDLAATVRAYEEGGACAVSILTEEDFFRGSLNDLRTAREAISLPILRKDFVFDEFQIYEAAHAGADAVLLIAAALPVDELERLRYIAEDKLGMDALVEVHTREEMDAVSGTGSKLIGVNNRDLRTFSVSLDVSRELIAHAPAGAILISESGISRREELIELRRLGYHGFLIGETLMRSGEPETSLRSLITEEGAPIDSAGIKNSV